MSDQSICILCTQHKIKGSEDGKDRNPPNKNPKHDPSQLQLPDPVQLRIALPAEHVLRDIAEHLAARLDDGLPPQMERAAPGREDDSRDEDRPDEEVDDTVDESVDRFRAPEDMYCVEDVVDEGESELRCHVSSMLYVLRKPRREKLHTGAIGTPSCQSPFAGPFVCTKFSSQGLIAAAKSANPISARCAVTNRMAVLRSSQRDVPFWLLSSSL